MFPSLVVGPPGEGSAGLPGIAVWHACRRCLLAYGGSKYLLMQLSEAQRQNAEFDFLNYPEGEHGFDGFNDTESSRAIIR